MRVTLIVVGAVFLTACAATPPRPDWLAGPSAAYAQSRYLVGRGQADTAEEAKDRARADLAKTFQVTVSASSEDTSAFARTNTGTVSRDARVRRSISTQTQQSLRGVRVAELWQDPDTKSFHALAVLSRAQAEVDLRQEIALLDAAIEGYVAQARASDDLLSKIRAAAKALALQRERDDYQRALKVVDASGRGVESAWGADLAADLDALLKRVRVAPLAAANAPPSLHALLSSALNAAGFALVGADQAEYRVRADLSLDDLRADGWHWAKGGLEVELLDAHGAIQGAHRWEIKTAAQDAGTARDRALSEAGQRLNSELREALLHMMAAPRP